MTAMRVRMWGNYLVFVIPPEIVRDYDIRPRDIWDVELKKCLLSEDKEKEGRIVKKV
jgi:antitoxin component of MazEF toxin-antitoxin module